VLRTGSVRPGRRSHAAVGVALTARTVLLAGHRLRVIIVTFMPKPSCQHMAADPDFTFASWKMLESILIEIHHFADTRDR